MKTPCRLLLVPALVAFAALPARGGDAFPADIFGGKVDVNEDRTVTFDYAFEDPDELRDWEGVLQGREGSDEMWVEDGALHVSAEGGDFAFAYLKTIFTGNVTIEARAQVQSGVKREIIFRLFSNTSSRGYLATLGYRNREGEMGSYLHKFPKNTLKTASRPEVTCGTWYDVEIEIRGRGIRMIVDGSTVMNVSDEDVREGPLGFGTFGAHVVFDAVRVTGTVQPAWLEGFASERVDAEATEGLDIRGESDWIDKMSEAARGKLRAGKKWFSAANYQEAASAFELAAELAPENPLPPFYLGRALMARGRHVDAGEAFQKAMDLGKGFPQAAVWRAKARLRTGRGSGVLARAEEDLRAAIEADGRLVEAFQALAHVYLMQGEKDAAVAAAQKAFRLAKAGAGSGVEEAERARDRYAWARDGLPLSRETTLQSALGPIHSDASSRSARVLGRWIVSLQSAVSMITGGELEGDRTIYLISDDATYETYHFPGDMVEAGEDAAWNTATDEILVRGSSESSKRLGAVAELLARMRAREAGAPPWIEEGLARYFRAIPSEGDERLHLDAVDATSAGKVKEALSADGLTALDRLVRMDREAFSSQEDFFGAESWSVVHFLRHDPRGDRDALSRIFERLRGGADAQASVEGFDWAGMESSWKRHISRLRD